MAKLKKIGESKIFGGWTKMFQHYSKSCSCVMKFSVFLPPQMGRGPVPVLTWLSGLTCTHENFITKAGAQKFAAEHGIVLVAPDTSPRGAGIEGEEEKGKRKKKKKLESLSWKWLINSLNSIEAHFSRKKYNVTKFG